MKADLESLVATREIVVTCGSGGVGKTTTAAALGLLAVRSMPARVLVLTVDPARRLADALGVPATGNEVSVVPSRVLSSTGPVVGELSLAMLDTKAGWDELIHRHAPNPTVRDELLANSVYANISGRFVHSHDYLAAERLYELHVSGRFDLIVVDTPPSRSALDFLDAPARMNELFEGRLVRWLTMPSRNRVLNMASKPFFDVADRILGSALLGDIVQFFSILQSMAPGFVERSRAVAQLLGDRRSSFIVVSTLEHAPSLEAEYLVAELERRTLHTGALVLNKVLPRQLAAASTGTAGRRLKADAAQIAATLQLDDAERAARVLVRLADNAADLQGAARLENDVRRRLSALSVPMAEVPWCTGEVGDLSGLALVADALAR